MCFTNINRMGEDGTEDGTVEGTYGSISRGDSPVVDTLPTLQHVYKTIGT